MATWTRRQQEIMDLVLDGTGTGSWLDIDSLMTLLGSSASKQATQCSLRILEMRGMLSRSYETRRGRKRMVLSPTPAAFATFRRSLTPP
jgi:hypothetical protein